jgi:hypothetical protein
LAFRAEKLKIRLGILQQLLTDLDKLADDSARCAFEGIDDLALKVDQFCATHGGCNSDVCIMTQDGINNLERRGDQASLLAAVRSNQE